MCMGTCGYVCVLLKNIYLGGHDQTILGTTIVEVVWISIWV